MEIKRVGTKEDLGVFGESHPSFFFLLLFCFLFIFKIKIIIFFFNASRGRLMALVSLERS
jgi:hypothetical protein